MKQIKMYESFFSGRMKNSGIPNSENYFNMLPIGLRNEVTRPVKDMLMNTNVKDWHALEFILPKIEKLMAKSGLQWNRFPAVEAVMRISPIKNMDLFVKWLEGGYYRALEDAYFS